MDLSKAFDCLPHYILLSKLVAYGLSSQSVKLLENYLTIIKQQIKLQGVVSGWQILQKGVPQGSIMGPCFLTFLLTIYFTSLDMEHCITMLMTTPYHMQIKIIIP
jgi:hypothetical protein